LVGGEPQAPLLPLAQLLLGEARAAGAGRCLVVAVLFVLFVLVFGAGA
jgi:hypothetical protein